MAGAFALRRGLWRLAHEVRPGLVPTKIMLVGTYFLSVWVTVHPFFLAIKQQRYLLVRASWARSRLAIVLFAVVISLGWGSRRRGGGGGDRRRVRGVGALARAVLLHVPAGPGRRDPPHLHAAADCGGALGRCAKASATSRGCPATRSAGGLLSLGMFGLIFGPATLFLLRSRLRAEGVRIGQAA